MSNELPSAPLFDIEAIRDTDPQSGFRSGKHSCRGIGYAPGEARWVTVNPWGRPSVEYDQDVLRSLIHADDSM